MQGGGGEVGGADVGGGGRAGAREARPMEQPGFGVQAGAAGVVADAHLGAVGHQPIEGAAVGGAQVDGCVHPQLAAGLGLQELGEGRLEQAQTAELDEGAEQSIRWAEGTSWISACPTDGSPLALTSRVLSIRGISGRMASVQG